MSDEYELLPAEELAKLRKDVEELRANPLGDTKQGSTLLQSVNKLDSSIHQLIKVFSGIKEDMTIEYEKVKAVDEQFVDLKEQNKKIASGILTVAKMLQDHHESIHENLAQKPEPIEDKPPIPDFTPEEPVSPVNDSPPFHPEPLSSNSFDQSMQTHKPKAPPTDPWAPNTNQIASPSQEQPIHQPLAPPVGQPSQGLPPLNSPPPPNIPPASSGDSFGMPPPPPPNQKKGVLGLFK